MDQQDALDNLFGQDKAKARQEEMLREHLERTKKFRQEVTRVALMPEGKELLAFIRDLCGWSEASTTYNPLTGEMNPMAMIYNQGRRNIWLELRKHLPSDVLADLETPKQEDTKWTETPPLQAEIPAIL